MLNVYASGFNAHNQLSLRPHTESIALLNDIFSLTKLTEDAKTGARVLFAGWSSTVLLLDDTIHILGHIDDSAQGPLQLSLSHNDIDPSSIRSVFGDVNGPLGLLTWTGGLYSFSITGTQVSLVQQGDGTGPTLSHVAIASNGCTSIIFLQARGSRMIHILEFQSFKDFQNWYADPSGNDIDAKPYKHHMMGGRAVTLLAGAICFVFLTEEAEVFTWGDGRHSRCLGRTPDTENPADRPCLVPALGGIPIAKVDGRGWMFGALSKDGDLYLWGRGKPGSEVDLSALFGDDQDEVKLLDGKEFENVQDFAVGNGHVVVKVSDGGYVYGENRNGQLGLGDNRGEFVDKWTMLETIQSDKRGQVTAGDASTFLLIEQ